MLFLDVLKENPMFMQKKEMEKSNYKHGSKEKRTVFPKRYRS